MNRTEYQARIIRPIHVGRGFQSSVFLVEWNGEPIAVKDFAQAPKWFRRLVAPILVAREVRALKHLNGTPGIPRLVGKVDRFAFALQFIEGTPISTFGRGELAPETFPRIAKGAPPRQKRHRGGAALFQSVTSQQPSTFQMVSERCCVRFRSRL